MGVFVGMGMVYLFAEWLAVSLLIGAIGAILLGMIFIGLFIYAITNPIRSLLGWVLFLVGSTTMIGLPFLVMDLIILHGKSSSLNDISLLQSIISITCFFALIGALVGTVALYEFCRDMTPAKQRQSHVGASLLTVIAILGVTCGGLAVSGNLSIITRAAHVVTGQKTTVAPTTPLATLPCTKLMSDFHTRLHLFDLAQANSRSAINSNNIDTKHEAELTEINASQDLEVLRRVLVTDRPQCLPAYPQAKFEIAKKSGMTITFDASASKGDGLTYTWFLGDINLADSIVIDSSGTVASDIADNLPKGTVVKRGHPQGLTFKYSIPGDYSPSLEVTDIYGRDSADYTTPVHV